MSQHNEADGAQRLALGLVGAIVALVVIGVLGLALSRGPAAAQRRAAQAAATAVVQDGMVQLHFAPGSAVLPAEAASALTGVVKEMAPGRRAIVAAFANGRDGSTALAARRAAAVRNLLRGLGLPAETIEVRPPAAAADAASAGRVDVMLVD